MKENLEVQENETSPFPYGNWYFCSSMIISVWFDFTIPLWELILEDFEFIFYNSTFTIPLWELIQSGRAHHCCWRTNFAVLHHSLMGIDTLLSSYLAFLWHLHHSLMGSDDDASGEWAWIRPVGRGRKKASRQGVAALFDMARAERFSRDEFSGSAQAG